jgi:hypothetical protein
VRSGFNLFDDLDAKHEEGSLLMTFGWAQLRVGRREFERAVAPRAKVLRSFFGPLIRRANHDRVLLYRRRASH